MKRTLRVTAENSMNAAKGTLARPAEMVTSL